jgi:hypothetical protein
MPVDVNIETLSQFASIQSHFFTRLSCLLLFSPLYYSYAATLKGAEEINYGVEYAAVHRDAPCGGRHTVHPGECNEV